MIYLKSALAGLGAVVVSLLILWAGLMLFLNHVLPRWGDSGGIGGVSVGFGTISLAMAFIIVLVIFGLGFYWEFRRASAGN